MRTRWIRSISLALVGLVILQGSAFADAIEGRVAGMDSRSMDVTVYDPQGRSYPNNLRVGIDSRTKVRGAESLSYLREGDPISADVRQLESGNWHADSVTLFQDVDARPATKNPPPTMRNVLGNPMVKGALLGAATGALASGASGGKAGKGALVGAGVGALGGLLFGGGGNDQDSTN